METKTKQNKQTNQNKKNQKKKSGIVIHPLEKLEATQTKEKWIGRFWLGFHVVDRLWR